MRQLPQMKRLLAVVLIAGFAAGAAAQLRTIPEDAKRGEIRHVEAMLVEIDGERQRLAPGAQIRDTSNRLIVPTAIPDGTRVKYLLDAEGMVVRVWVLTPEEEKQ